MLSFLGETWGMGSAAIYNRASRSSTRRRFVTLADRSPGTCQSHMDGTIADAFLEQLAALSKAFPKKLNSSGGQENLLKPSRRGVSCAG